MPDETAILKERIDNLTTTVGNMRGDLRELIDELRIDNKTHHNETAGELRRLSDSLYESTRRIHDRLDDIKECNSVSDKAIEVLKTRLDIAFRFGYLIISAIGVMSAAIIKILFDKFSGGAH